MAAKWVTEQNTGGTPSTSYFPAVDGVKQLPDGTLIQLLYDAGTGNLSLYYSTDHVTQNLIWAIGNTFGQAGGGGVTLCIDSSSNIYVVGQSLNQGPQVQCFIKGAGYTWTVKPPINIANLQTRIGWCTARWVNTTGGTGHAGHIVMVIWGSIAQGQGAEAFVLDAGIAQAGVGTLLVGSYPTSPLANSGFAIGDLCLSPDCTDANPGATSGIATQYLNYGGSYVVQVVAWSVSASGVLTASQIGTFPVPPGISTSKVRCLRVGSGLWGCFSISATSHAGVYYWQAVQVSGGVVSAPVDSGAVANLPSNTTGSGSSLWDGFADPIIPNQAWVLALETATNSTVVRLGCVFGGGAPTWAAAVTVDDTLFELPGATAHTVYDLRVVRQPSISKVDYQEIVQDVVSGVSNYAYIGDYGVFASLPAAMSQTSPLNGGFGDGSQGFTFQATWNPTDGSNQNAYALRIKQAGSPTYLYFNASSNSLQVGIVWNACSTAPGGTTSAGVPPGLLTNGLSYNWSMAGQSVSGLQGPFASDFTVTCRVDIALVVTEPSGQVITATPVVGWVATPAPGCVQIAYRVIMYDQAQFTAGGFTPGSGPSIWDSGVVQASASSVQSGALTVNLTTYRAYVQVTQTGGQTSLWAYSGFTLFLDTPATPTLTLVNGYDPNGIPAVLLNVATSDNLLSAAQSSFEAQGGIVGWAALTNCTINQVFGLASDGNAAMAMSATAGGAMTAVTPSGTSGIPVLGGQQMTAMAAVMAVTNAENAHIGINWFKANGTASSHPSDTGSTIVDSTSAWQQMTCSVVAPADAAYAQIVVVTTGAGAHDTHLIDSVSLVFGTSTVWTIGGFIGSQLASIFRSDDGGATYAPIRFSSIALTVPQQTATLYDYEAVPGAPTQYVADISALGTPSPVSTVAPITPTITHHWLIDPLIPANSVLIVSLTEPWEITSSEPGAPYFALGRSDPWVVSDVISLDVLKLDLLFPTLAMYTAFRKLRGLQRTLLLKSAMEVRQWYGRFQGDLVVDLYNPVPGQTSNIREGKVTYYETAAP